MIEVSSEAVASQEDEDCGEDDDDDEEIPKYPMMIPSPMPTPDNANVTMTTLLVDQCMFKINFKENKIFTQLKISTAVDIDLNFLSKFLIRFENLRYK